MNDKNIVHGALHRNEVTHEVEGQEMEDNDHSTLKIP